MSPQRQRTISQQRLLRRGEQWGVSLLEALLAIVILVLAGGALLPLYAQQQSQQRAAVTLQKQQAIVQAIMGRDFDNLGFVGDIGRLPLTLQELLSNPNNLPTFAVNSTTGVASGWNGPYLAAATGENPLVDGWGVAFTYNATTGRIASNGPDQVAGTADDLTFPINPIAVQGTLVVTPFVNNIPNPASATLTVWENNNGVQQQVSGSPFSTTTEFITTTAGYSFFLSQGVHAIQVQFTPANSTTPEVNTIEKIPVRGGKQTLSTLKLTSNHIVNAVSQ